MIYQMTRLTVSVGKRKTSLEVDDDVWMRFMGFVVRKHKGHSKKMSEETMRAITEYLDKHESEYP